MSRYTTEERIFIVELYFWLNESISENLTFADFFFGGYFKQRVYANKPVTINNLKNNIKEEIRA